MTQISDRGVVIYSSLRELYRDIGDTGYNFVSRILPSNGNCLEESVDMEISIYPGGGKPSFSILVSKSDKGHLVLPGSSIDLPCNSIDLFEKFIERLEFLRERRRLGI